MSLAITLPSSTLTWETLLENVDFAVDDDVLRSSHQIETNSPSLSHSRRRRLTTRADGVRLPANHRQSVHSSNGTLVIKEVSRESDEGQYTCSASNRRGIGSKSGINLIMQGKRSTLKLSR